MEFPAVTVCIFSVIVINAVGNVGGLLNLSNETACTNGMHPPCWQEKDITLAHFISLQCIGEGVVLYRFNIGFRGNAFLETSEKKCTGSCLDDVPHLGLTE